MIRLLVLSILISITVTSFAQNFRLAFQASPHVTWMNSSKGDIVNSAVRPGLKYGLETDFFLGDLPRYSINTGLFVSNHSFSAKYSLDNKFVINDATFDKIVELTYKLNYIEIPLNIKLRSDQFHRMTFFGQFGLSNLFNISASATSSDNQLNGDAINESTFNRSIRFYTLCMLMGGGVEYDVGGNTAINVGIQYSNGLSDITSFEITNEKTIINSVRLVLGVVF